MLHQHASDSSDDLSQLTLLCNDLVSAVAGTGLQTQPWNARMAQNTILAQNVFIHPKGQEACRLTPATSELLHLKNRLVA